MRQRRTAILVGSLALAGAMACKRGAAPPPAAPDAGAAPARVEVRLPARGVGMDDPFARMNAESVKALRAGYAALGAKRYDDARAAFGAVVAALPDHTGARFQQVRAAALAGRTADVAPLWGELLVRDFVAYRGRLDKPKDLGPLRASPEWAGLRAVEEAARAAYAAGLERGAFFLARTRPAGAEGELHEWSVDPGQEVFHLDLPTGRYRRLTDSGGEVFAMHVAPDRKTLAVLLVTTLGRLPNGKTAFRDAQAELVDLRTLETSGPRAFGPVGSLAAEVTMCPSAAGEPLWVVSDGASPTPAAFAFDATGATLVRAAGAVCVPDAGTEAGPDGVRRLHPEDTRARLSDTGDLLRIEGAPAPLRLAFPVDPASLAWSPGGKRLVYAGLAPPCRPGGGATAGKQAVRNELFLWEAGRKRPARIATGGSRFESAWLDDDHLLYEVGAADTNARLYLYDVAAARAAPLKARVGAVLYGQPAAACDEDLAHADEADPAPYDEDDGSE